jgi:pyruvate dehydrogenase E2 component (dihydrolipoamide acetyltransferase)
MPQLSPTMTEGRLTGWLKKEGDKISAGDVIAEVETDKATMEVEATEDGIIHQLIGKAGEDIPVGTPIAVLKEKGEAVPEGYAPTSGVAAPVVEEKAAQEEAVGAAPAQAPAAPPVAAASPLPKPVANLAPPVSAASAGGVAPRSARVKASPLARRIAQAKGLALAAIQGSGPGGRVVAADVSKALSMGGGPAQIIRHKDMAEKLSPMRKAVAGRLTASKQYIPHFYLNADIHMDALLETRRQLNTYARGQFKLSVNDFIVKACAVALAQHPAANAAWAEDSIVTFGNVDVSVAVAIEGGLVTPIVFNAEQKTLVQISEEIKALATAARAGKLKPEQYEGGSFTVSNLGMYGTQSFSAIINPPQAAILACGGAAERAVPDGKGGVTTAQVMSVSLSVDHRVVDGALGAELLASMKQALENPVTLLL